MKETTAYIRGQLSEGVDKRTIVQGLVANGWTYQQALGAFAAATRVRKPKASAEVATIQNTERPMTGWGEFGHFVGKSAFFIGWLIGKALETIFWMVLFLVGVHYAEKLGHKLFDKD